jgi:hypothetical protein
METDIVMLALEFEGFLSEYESEAFELNRPEQR